MKILSFDPGLSYSGWAYTDADNGIFSVEQCGLLTPNKTVDHKEHRDEVELYGRRIITLALLRVMVRDLINRFHPDIVVSEDAFFNPRRPGAYEALIQWILTVSFILRDEFQLPLYRIPPKLVKKYISGMGTADKEGVKKAVAEHKDIRLSPDINIDNLLEHEGDAIAIGYTRWRMLTD